MNRITLYPTRLPAKTTADRSRTSNKTATTAHLEQRHTDEKRLSDAIIIAINDVMVEHIHFPRLLRFIPPAVPYVVSSAPKDAYDGLEFSSFPERRGFNKDDLLKGDFAGRNDSELSEFFQAWLFFGMLSEVLSAAGQDFSLDDYVLHGMDGRFYIESLPLRDHLLDWVKREQSLAQSSLSDPSTVFAAPWLERVRRIDRCLDEARTFTQRLLCPSSSSSLPADRLPNIIPEISLSIIILGATLAEAKYASLPQNIKEKLVDCVGSDLKMIAAIKSGDVPYLHGGGMREWGPAEYSLMKLRQSGWCPKEIEMIKELSDADMLFCSHLSRQTGSLGSNHSKCTPQKCIAFQVDDITYEPFHRDHCRGCNNVVFSTSHVANLVMQDKIPLVRVVNRNGSYKLELGDADDCEYVAISHVWVQGMGNRNANSLPKCRIEFIWTLVNAMCGNPDTGSVSFWIDTLCVPLQPQQARRLAITQMKDVYRKAKTVLVLDEELLRVSCHIPNTLGMIQYPNDMTNRPEDMIHQIIDYDFIQSTRREVIIRLYISPWSRRLWTLHEGALAQDLVVAFADGIYPLKNIVRSKLNWELLTVPYQQISATAMTVASNFLDLGGGLEHHGLIFGLLGSLLCHRATSFLSDEAVCLAGILNLNTAELFEAGDTAEDRMLGLYSQLSQVPSSLLFLDGPKLAVLGFRWAPLSLLGTRLNTVLATEALLTDRIVTPEKGYWGGGLFVATGGVLLENLTNTGPSSKVHAQPFDICRLPPTFFVVDLWHGLTESGQGEELNNFSSALSGIDSRPPYLNTEVLLTTVWRVTYSGSMPWDDVIRLMNDRKASITSDDVHNKTESDGGTTEDSNSFGLIIQPNVEQYRDNGTAIKRAALLTNLSRRYMTINPDGLREFRDLTLEDTRQENQAGVRLQILSSAVTLWRVSDVEEITLEKWSNIKQTMSSPGSEDPIAFQPRSGGIIEKWIVR